MTLRLNVSAGSVGAAMVAQRGVHLRPHGEPCLCKKLQPGSCLETPLTECLLVCQTDAPDNHRPSAVRQRSSRVTCAAQPTAEPLLSSGPGSPAASAEEQGDFEHESMEDTTDMDMEEEDGEYEGEDDVSQYLDSSEELEAQEQDPYQDPEVVKAQWREAMRQRLGVESERILIHDLGVYLELTADRPWVQTMKLRWAIANAERDKEQLCQYAPSLPLHPDMLCAKLSAQLAALPAGKVSGATCVPQSMSAVTPRASC